MDKRREPQSPPSPPIAHRVARHWVASPSGRLTPAFAARQLDSEDVAVAEGTWYGPSMAGDDEDDSSRRGPLIAMGVVVLLVVVGWLITRALHNSTKLEDCLMSGRTNCAPVQTQGQ
jgi:hypothetical protein